MCDRREQKQFHFLQKICIILSYYMIKKTSGFLQEIDVDPLSNQVEVN